MRQFYLIANPMTTVMGDTMAALHGSDPAVRKAPLMAWVARAMATGTLAVPCGCCNQPTDMVIDADPSQPIAHEQFFKLYRELSTTRH